MGENIEPKMLKIELLVLVFFTTELGNPHEVFEVL